MADTNGHSLDQAGSRPDLTGQMLDLAPGQWWSPDGHLHIEVLRVGSTIGPASDRALPYGWTWLVGDLYVEGRPVDLCTVPVRTDALPGPVLVPAG